jgi:hypothetical protein
MSRVNNEQMKALVAAFMERVTGGAPVDEAWRSRTAAMAPELPAHPTPAQIEAWTELAGMLQDRTSCGNSRRASARSGTVPGMPTRISTPPGDHGRAFRNCWPC